MPGTLVICDFDGTLTATDTNSHLAAIFAPEQREDLEGKLASREMTLREVLAAETSAMTAGEAAIVDEAVRGVAMRPGFARLVNEVRERGGDVVLLSSGYRQIIQPMLDAAGVGQSVQLIANDVEYRPDGGVVAWRELPMCDLCGEPCKRYDVACLRVGTCPDVELPGAPFDRVVYVGDGYSDRCGAETADLVFARDALADYLAERDEPFILFDDLDDVARMLTPGTHEA